MRLIDVLKQSNPGITGCRGRFGIEIETETLSGDAYPKNFLKSIGIDQDGHTVYQTPLKHWMTKTDGSLRNFGIEYILTEPQDMNGVEEALQEFGKLEIDFLARQPSTSVHVHMNFQNETLLTLANFVHVWFLFENPLIEYCGDIRRSNCFALGARLAEQQIANFQKMFRGIESGNYGAFNFQQQAVKYASLNLGVLFKLGSLEARSFRGVTDIEDIRRWTSILNNLFEFAKLPGLTPREIAMSYKDKGLELMTDVFGQYSSDLKCVGYEAMIDRNEKIFYDLVTSVKNWDTFGLSFEGLEKKRPKKSKPTSLADMIAPGYIFTANPHTHEMTIAQSPAMYTLDTAVQMLDELEEGPF